jgi:hypothetical protein
MMPTTTLDTPLLPRISALPLTPEAQALRAMVMLTALLHAWRPFALAGPALLEALAAVTCEPSRATAAAVEAGFREIDETLAQLRRAWMDAPLVLR